MNQSVDGKDKVWNVDSKDEAMFKPRPKIDTAQAEARPGKLKWALIAAGVVVAFASALYFLTRPGDVKDVPRNVQTVGSEDSFQLP